MVLFCSNRHDFSVWLLFPDIGMVLVGGGLRFIIIIFHSFNDAVLGVKPFLPSASVSCHDCIFWYLLFLVGALGLSVDIPLRYKLWFNSYLFGYAMSKLERFMQLHHDIHWLQAFESCWAQLIHPPTLSVPSTLCHQWLVQTLCHKRIREVTLDWTECCTPMGLVYITLLWGLVSSWWIGYNPFFMV